MGRVGPADPYRRRHHRIALRARVTRSPIASRSPTRGFLPFVARGVRVAPSAFRPSTTSNDRSRGARAGTAGLGDVPLARRPGSEGASPCCTKLFQAPSSCPGGRAFAVLPSGSPRPERSIRRVRGACCGGPLRAHQSDRAGQQLASKQVPTSVTLRELDVLAHSDHTPVAAPPLVGAEVTVEGQSSRQAR